MTFIGFMQYVSFFGQVATNVTLPLVLFLGAKALRKYLKG